MHDNVQGSLRKLGTVCRQCIMVWFPLLLLILDRHERFGRSGLERPHASMMASVKYKGKHRYTNKLPLVGADLSAG